MGLLRTGGWVVGAGALFTAFLLGSLTVGTPTAGAASSQTAEALYKAECLMCHGAQGDGKGPAAVALKPKPPSFADPQFWKTRSEAEVGGGIRTGKVGTGMPSWPNLTDAELSELVKYLRGFSP